MNSSVTGHWFDGRTLAARPAILELDGATLRITGLDAPEEALLGRVGVSDRLGRTARFLHFPGGGSFETLDNDGVDRLLAARGGDRVSALIHWLEERSRIAAVATLLLVAVVGASTYIGLPVLCHRAAVAVPVNIEQSAGEAALASLRQWLRPSVLDQAKRQRVAVQLTRVTQANRLSSTPRIEYRSMGTFPNAFAFPGGIIVMSDELVALATDDELAAVLAHEIGHWQLRHGLQSVFRSSAALLVVTTVTGDLSTLTSFAAAIPLTLLQRGYSREFEQEADDYAVDMLRRAKIDTRALASILAKLEQSRPGRGADYSYLSTHPATGDRTKRIDPTGTYVGLLKPESVPPPVAPADELSEGEEISTPETPAPPDGQAPPVAASDEVPTPLARVGPEYPFWLRATGVEGTVTVEFIVDRDGNVQNAVAVKTTHAEFSEAALEALRQWKFRPGRKHGRTVNTRASIDIPFTLTKE